MRECSGRRVTWSDLGFSQSRLRVCTGGLVRKNCRREVAVRYIEVMVNSEPVVAMGMESGPGQ